MSILGVGLEIGGLYFLADEIDVTWRDKLLEIRQVALINVRRELFLFDLFFQHLKQVYRVGGNLRGIEIEDFG